MIKAFFFLAASASCTLFPAQRTIFSFYFPGFVTRFLAYLLTTLLLLQSFGRELLVLHFALNQAALTQQYCLNKARPRLHCNGKCYLARQLRRAENGPAKAPAGSQAKVKFEVLAPARFWLTPPAEASPAAARRYAALAAPAHLATPLPGIFHPPALLG